MNFLSFFFSITSTRDEWICFYMFFLNILRSNLPKKPVIVQTKFGKPNSCVKSWYYWKQKRNKVHQENNEFSLHCYLSTWDIFIIFSMNSHSMRLKFSEYVKQSKMYHGRNIRIKWQWHGEIIEKIICVTYFGQGDR
jgi:hypothetical protein